MKSHVSIASALIKYAGRLVLPYAHIYTHIAPRMLALSREQ